MNDWTIFASLFDQIGPVVLSSTDAMATALQAWVRQYIIAGVTLFVLASLVCASVHGKTDNPLNDAVWQTLIGAFALYLAGGMAGYGPMVRDILLNGISREIGMAMSSSLGNRPVSGALFDEIWNRAWLAGLAVFRNLPWSGAGIALGGLVVLYWLIAIIATVVAFMVWLQSYLFVAVLVGVGPIFVGLFAFPWFRGIFWGWLRTALANVVLQILAVALLTLLLGAMTRIMAILAVPPVGIVNEISQLKTLLGGVVLFLGCGWLAAQLPGTAAAITHGFTGYGHMPRGGNGPGSGAPNQTPPQRDQQPGGGTPNPSGPPPVSPAMPRGSPPGRALG